MIGLSLSVSTMACAQKAAWRSPRQLALAPAETRIGPATLAGCYRTGDIQINENNGDPIASVVTLDRQDPVWQTQIILPVPGPIRAEDRFTLRFRARGLTPGAGLAILVMKSSEPWMASLTRNIELAEAWRDYTFSFKAATNEEPGKTNLAMHFGQRGQRLELSGLKLVAHGQEQNDAVTIIEPSPSWRPLDMANPQVEPGSALDFSRLVHPEPAGAHGRVIINAKGQFEFEKRPGERVLFWGCSINMGPGGFTLRHDMSTLPGDNLHRPLTKEDIAEFVRRMRLQGYNLFRPHFLDAALMENAAPDQEFDPVALDRFDYLVHCLKQNGIYLYLDAATRTGSWSHGGGWGGDGQDHKTGIYYDPAIRDLWAGRVRSLLTRTNAYTGTRLVDDPMVTVILFFNEQEISPWGTESFPAGLLPMFRSWLKDKYDTTEALRQAWTDPSGTCHLPAAETIDTASANPFWGNSPRALDINRFIQESEENLLAWYEQNIRDMGYPGITSQYDCTFRYRNHAVRAKGVQAISIHTYVSTPSAWLAPGSRVSQDSSILTDDAYRLEALWARYPAEARLGGRPLMVTEYNHEFWGRYRHEEPFTLGAYSAYQDYDMLIAHAHPVMLSVERPILPFFLGADPIQRASQVLTTLLFARRDISPFRSYAQFSFDDDFMYGQGRASGGIGWDNAQAKLSLVIGTGSAYTAPGGKLLGGHPEAITLNLADLPALDALVADLRRRGVLPEGNRTHPHLNQYETDTGELFMRRGLAQVDVKTPRTEGATLLADGSQNLNSLNIVRTSVDAAISISSLDDHPIAESRRLLLIIATDALNTKMAFAGADRGELADIGGLPVLIQTGNVDLALANRHAGALQLWGLDMNGKRAEKLPVNVDAKGVLTLSINTASTQSPWLFYELFAKDE
jgi:hypothetical protein